MNIDFKLTILNQRSCFDFLRKLKKNKGELTSGIIFINILASFPCFFGRHARMAPSSTRKTCSKS